MGTYSSDGMYSTDCDSREEDDSEYYDSSSDESGELGNLQSTSEEDIFFSFSGNSKPLRIHDFFQVGKSNNPFSYLWRVFHPWDRLPLASKL